MYSSFSRRKFILNSGLLTLGFLGLRKVLKNKQPKDDVTVGFGNLIKDNNKIIDLPSGFSYQIISPAGEIMDDGLIVPPLHDGMCVINGKESNLIIVRNHEISKPRNSLGPFGFDNDKLKLIDKSKIYDLGSNKSDPCRGGCTTVVYDTNEKKVIKSFLSLAGTEHNCAGGLTPRKTWLSCEESTVKKSNYHAKDHGWIFEVPITENIELTVPIPIKPMGRMNHEAVCVDPRTNIVYMTEDRDDACWYRFIPNKPDDYHQGGLVQALIINGISNNDVRHWSKEKVLNERQQYNTRWVTLENIDSPNDNLRFQAAQKGSAVFARTEGTWFDSNSVYFACTSGGEKQLGQIFRYFPSKFEGTPNEELDPGKIELFVESNEANILESPDNITASPWGDLFVCEDGLNGQYLIGVTPKGQLYTFAHNALNGSEFSGATFSPDGNLLLVNIQNPGLTLVIEGPWEKIHKLGPSMPRIQH